MTAKSDRAARKRERVRLDDEWSNAVQERDGNKCQKCGSDRALKLRTSSARRRTRPPDTI